MVWFVLCFAPAIFSLTGLVILVRHGRAARPLLQLATVSRRGDRGAIQDDPATAVTIVASDDPNVCHLRAMGRPMGYRLA